MVEHSAVNRRVGGSSPLHGAILFNFNQIGVYKSYYVYVNVGNLKFNRIAMMKKNGIVNF